MKKAKQKRDVYKPAEAKSRHLILPSPMDQWLLEFTARHNYNSPTEAVRAILREKQQAEQALATV